MSATTNARPETNAERIKREKDGLQVWADILRYAQTGFASITPDDQDRFKWYGLYTQRPAEEGFFMLRVKVPGGALSAEQLETIGWLSQVHARSTGDITTRQAIQLHYVRIEDVPHIIGELEKVGLTTNEACGDVVRNVVGCPLAGLDADEVFDASPLIAAITEKFIHNPAYSNLPRKFKISLTGCRHHCAQHEINDIGLIATRNAAGEHGFDLWVGGGLGARPFLAKNLGVFVAYDEALEVITRIVEIFRDSGYRADRKRARLKFLLADWGVEKFRTELESKLGRQLADSFPGNDFLLDNQSASDPHAALRDHTGVNPQRQSGLFAVGAATLRGRFSGEQMVHVAGLARRYGSGRVRLTNSQNLLLPDVAAADVATMQAELRAVDLQSDASAFRRGTVACTGRQFCKLANVETKDRAAEIITHLEHALPDWQSPLRVSVTGCTNACAQYQVAEIGLVGVKGQVNGVEQDFFQIHLGGHLGNGTALGRKLNQRVHVDDAKDYLERLLRVYRSERLVGERFYEFIARHDAAQLEAVAARAQQLQAFNSESNSEGNPEGKTEGAHA